MKGGARAWLRRSDLTAGPAWVALARASGARPSGFSRATVATAVPATCPETEATTHCAGWLRSVRWCAEWSAASNANSERIRMRASAVTRRIRRQRSAGRKVVRRRAGQRRAKASGAGCHVDEVGSMTAGSPVAGATELGPASARAGSAMPSRTRAVRGGRSRTVTVSFPGIERSSSQ